MLVNEAWQVYEEMVLASAKKHSQITEKGRWNNHISPLLGQKEIEKLTSLDYFTLKRDIEKKISPQTVRHCLSLLRRVLNRAKDFDLVKQEIPSFRRIFPQFDNRRERFLSKTEAAKLIHELSGSEWHDIVRFGLNTGLRAGEIFGLKKDHINFDSKFMCISDTKTGKNRIAPLNSTAVDILYKKIHQDKSIIFF
jgi:integrase